jgi:uncharacterized iron-regulated protein
MLGALISLAIDVDPYLLKLGAPGTVTAQYEKLVDTKTGKVVDVATVAAAADNVQYVYLGESHNNPDHHAMQASIIDALVARGRNVIVGMEMFTRPVQDQLNPWTLGWWDEATFIERSDWKKQWGFDYSLYRPIFESVKKSKLPLIALNVPRDWVRAVGRGGFAALTPEQKKELPAELFLGNTDHKQVFEGLMGGHPMTGPQGDNIYAAQVLWDEGMADTAIKVMAEKGASRNTMFVVVAGSGHVMYEQGINYRIKRRTGADGITVMKIDGTEPREVSRGIGHFIYMAKPGKS